MNSRLAAVKVLTRVVRDKRSLTAVLETGLGGVNPADRGLVQALCFGVLRWYPRLVALLDKLLDKPLRAKDTDLQCTLLLGLYQLGYMRIPDHAAVAETVSLPAKLGKHWAKNLVNAVLRNYQRQAASLQASADAEPVSQYAHPRWLLEVIQEDWPEHWQAILMANNQAPPMSLRVNLCKLSRVAALQSLNAANIEARPIPFTDAGIQLAKPIAVESLPGFADGALSVQDGAAQLVAPLLGAQAGERILDACAAPGGKTAHLLESQPALGGLTALDIDPARLQRVEENLKRLHLQADLLAGDASCPADWWDGTHFDRILVDAPCSATGVIRRHPDIKLLRQETDIAALARQQQAILHALWPLLKPGGMLLYVTCSVLVEENVRSIRRFTETHQDAHLAPIEACWGQPLDDCRQILPGNEDMDGFFYARLAKN